MRALFRGNELPPVLGDYPEIYNDVFILLDLHVLEISKIFGDRRDAEMLEIYSALRRRPDGPSRELLAGHEGGAELWSQANRGAGGGVASP